MLDSWNITDADLVWDFRVVVTQDTSGTRPEKDADVYDVVAMDASGPEAVRWARDAVKAWENDEWCFANIDVTPVLKESEAVFEGARESLAMCDWGWLPGGEDGKGVHTSTLDYARKAWIDEMINVARDRANEMLEKIKNAD